MKIKKYKTDRFTSIRDIVIGSDADDDYKTKNYEVESLIDLVGAAIDISLIQYIAHDRSDASITFGTPGTMFPLNAASQSILNPLQVTRINVSKHSKNGVDASEYFKIYQASIGAFVMRIKNGVNTMEVYYFDVTAVTEHTDYFSLDVTVVNEVSSKKSFKLGEAYAFDMVLKPDSSGGDGDVFVNITWAGLVAHLNKKAGQKYNITDSKSGYPSPMGQVTLQSATTFIWTDEDGFEITVNIE